MRPIKRAKLRLGSFIALCVTGAFAVPLFMGAASAQAQTAPDPQTTNVPYLAWVGEQIRMVKCFSPDAFDGFGPGSAEFQVESWSNDPGPRPTIEQSTVQLVDFGTTFCAVGDAIAFQPGMARIELDVTNGIGVTSVKHQFLDGWMTIDKTSLTELAATDFASTAVSAATSVLGDPKGDGHLFAGAKPGILSVKVTGTLPTPAWSAELGGATSVTLPDDWAKLAAALATSSDPNDPNPAMRWDIHDGTTDTEGHVNPGICDPAPTFSPPSPPTPPGTDAVDNCVGGDQFSRVFGDLTLDPSIGPFDPVRPDATLLSDGLLNAADAPMPAARIDVSIAQNSGGSTDISGVGSLNDQLKTQSYSRDFTGNDTPHNLYAPFYSAFIPATSPLLASGIDGPASGNNFPGFLWNGEYPFWHIANVFSFNSGSPTRCLERSLNPQSGDGRFFSTPSGNASVAVYTDEHGEAQVRWTPGTGFFFDSLINLGRATLNLNGGCDLQDVGLLGTADISAKAVYPYKPVDFPPVMSDPVHKDVTSLWSKTLSYFAKGTGAANGNARIVLAHAQNIDGSPFAGEPICFSSDAESMSLFDGVITDNAGNEVADTRGTTTTPDPKGGLGRLCVVTNDSGDAAVEVFESKSVHVNVVADFAQEGILRSIDVDFTTPGSGENNLPTPPQGGSTTPTAATTSQNGTTTPSAAVINKIAPALAPTGSTLVKKVSPRLTLARLYRPLQGRHYVALKVTSKSPTARIRLVMTTKVRVVRHGKVRTITRRITKVITVRTGRTITVTVPSAVISVKATLLR